jgi:hypothetical protein
MKIWKLYHNGKFIMQSANFFELGEEARAMVDDGYWKATDWEIV